jgi:hypothetical protein
MPLSKASTAATSLVDAVIRKEISMSTIDFNSIKQLFMSTLKAQAGQIFAELVDFACKSRDEDVIRLLTDVKIKQRLGLV